MLAGENVRPTTQLGAFICAEALEVLLTVAFVSSLQMSTQRKRHITFLVIVKEFDLNTLKDLRDVRGSVHHTCKLVLI